MLILVMCVYIDYPGWRAQSAFDHFCAHKQVFTVCNHFCAHEQGFIVVEPVYCCCGTSLCQ